MGLAAPEPGPDSTSRGRAFRVRQRSPGRQAGRPSAGVLALTAMSGALCHGHDGGDSPQSSPRSWRGFGHKPMSPSPNLNRWRSNKAAGPCQPPRELSRVTTPPFGMP
jgi:hypothetical protein